MANHDDMDCSKDFTQRNFALSEFTDSASVGILC